MWDQNVQYDIGKFSSRGIMFPLDLLNYSLYVEVMSSRIGGIHNFAKSIFFQISFWNPKSFCPFDVVHVADHTIHYIWNRMVSSSQIQGQGVSLELGCSWFIHASILLQFALITFFFWFVQIVFILKFKLMSSLQSHPKILMLSFFVGTNYDTHLRFAYCCKTRNQHVFLLHLMNLKVALFTNYDQQTIF